MHTGNHPEDGHVASMQQVVIIITFRQRISVIIAVYLVVRGEKEVHSIEMFYQNGSIKLKILQMAAKMSREVAEACERIKWAGVEEVRVSFFSMQRAFLKAFLPKPFCSLCWWRLFLRIQSRIHLSGGGCSATLDPSGRHPEQKGSGQAPGSCFGHCHAGLSHLLAKSDLL